MNATRNFLRSKDMAGAVDALTVSRMIWVVFAKNNDGTSYGSRTMDEILCKLEVEAGWKLVEVKTERSKYYQDWLQPLVSVLHGDCKLGLDLLNTS